MRIPNVSCIRLLFDSNWSVHHWDRHYLCDVNKLENILRAAARFCKGDYKYSSIVTSTIKIWNGNPWPLAANKRRLYAQSTKFEMTSFMYISLRTWLQQQKLGLVDLMVLNVLLNIQVTMYLNTLIFLEQWGNGIAANSLPSDIVSAISLDIFKSMLSDYLRGD